MKTVLYDRHVALKAKIVDFAGWEMPVQYGGILQECHAVRENVGIFDVSHMGRILISGPDAERFLDYLSTNKISEKKDNSATYTVWCNEKGHCVDDVIIYRQDKEHFFTIVNAGNRKKDLQHLLEHKTHFNVSIEPRFDKEGILAIQGPGAMSLVQQQFPEAADLKPMRFLTTEDIIISGTGYTGAGGCEIYAPLDKIVTLWDQFTAKGAVPVGLGARDALRLEMGFALYGHEISDSISPIESIAAWTVKWDKDDFLGKDALRKLRNTDNKRSEYGILMQERGVPREGYPITKEGSEIGYVTSGTHSPTLNQGIAIILVNHVLSPDESVDVLIRGKPHKAKVVALPFIKGAL